MHLSSLYNMSLSKKMYLQEIISFSIEKEIKVRIMSLTDTHTYDGKLDRSWVKYSEEPLENQRKALSLLRERIKEDNLSNFDTIIRDWESKSRSNYDPTNDLDAGELLSLSTKYTDCEDFNLLLNHALNEMKTGMCPQGRSTRIYSLLLAFKDYSL